MYWCLAKNLTPKPRDQTGAQWRRHWQSKSSITRATWNVQGCRVKMQEMIKEMEQLRINIASITETKKKGSGPEVIGNNLYFYSDVPKENGEERSLFTNQQKLKHNIPNW